MVHVFVPAWFPRDVLCYNRDDSFALFQQNLLFQVLEVYYVVQLKYVVLWLVHVGLVLVSVVHVLMNVMHVYELFHVSY